MSVYVYTHTRKRGPNLHVSFAKNTTQYIWYGMSTMRVYTYIWTYMYTHTHDRGPHMQVSFAKEAHICKSLLQKRRRNTSDMGWPRWVYKYTRTTIYTNSHKKPTCKYTCWSLKNTRLDLWSLRGPLLLHKRGPHIHTLTKEAYMYTYMCWSLKSTRLNLSSLCGPLLLHKRGPHIHTCVDLQRHDTLNLKWGCHIA